MRFDAKVSNHVLCAFATGMVEKGRTTPETQSAKSLESFEWHHRTITKVFPSTYSNALAVLTKNDALVRFCTCEVNFTVPYSLVPSMQASKPEAVLVAAGITAFITLGLTAFALQSKYDFTTSNGILTGALLALVLVSMARMFFPTIPFVEMAIAGGGAFLFSCFIVVDIQILMDGAFSV